jgi:hypothetical protein
MSSNRRETRVKLPLGLQLRSLACVCSSALLLHCDAGTLSQGLGDVLLGYTTIAGTGVSLVARLSARLEVADLIQGGELGLRQKLLFTRGELMGEWWNAVYQPSIHQVFAEHDLDGVPVWAYGERCPSHLTFPRYGIIGAHEQRDVLPVFPVIDHYVADDDGDDDESDSSDNESLGGASDGALGDDDIDNDSVASLAIADDDDSVLAPAENHFSDDDSIHAHDGDGDRADDLNDEDDLLVREVHIRGWCHETLGYWAP